MASFDPAAVSDLQAELERHPVYGALRGLPELRLFMEHHVYSVWDFMSLIKTLQGRLAPVTVPWSPEGAGEVRYFINQLVLEEESDEAPPGADGVPGRASHYELYLQAMAEVGADPAPARQFVERARSAGIDAALEAGGPPEPARGFVAATFGFIATGRPHVVAAALALGREHVIPGMFREFIARIGIAREAAPAFHYYLHRHVHLDADFHGPLSLRMVDALCAGEPRRVEEAQEAARSALRARIRFWDGVMEALSGGAPAAADPGTGEAT